MTGIKIETPEGKFEYFKSDRLGKKLMVTVNGKLIHFGDTAYQHYLDRTKLVSDMDHLDVERRRRYMARAGSIRNKDGKRTVLDPESPNYHSYHILW